MIAEVGSLITSAAFGSAMKVASGMVSGWLEGRRIEAQQKHQQQIELIREKRKTYVETVFPLKEDAAAVRFTLWTRRLLACAIVFTFCYILIRWAEYPTATIIAYQPQAGSEIRLLWGLFSYPVEASQLIQVSTGSLVWASMHLVSMVVSMYFTPSYSK